MGELLTPQILYLSVQYILTTINPGPTELFFSAYLKENALDLGIKNSSKLTSNLW